MKNYSHLTDLLANIADVAIPENPKITGLTQDSRSVNPGDLFFAVSGTKQDGKQFIDDAIQNGAAAILIDDAMVGKGAQRRDHQIPIIAIPNLTAKIGHMAARFYHNPSHHMQVIGITGTNGKTSCSHFLAEALEMSGQICGIIGTVGYGLYKKLQPAELTTPDAITIQRLLAEFKQAGARYVVMEVSSHSLVQHRVAGVEFSIGVFTNLTREHLDYHGDMESYAQAKRQLFATPGLRYAVLNADDPYGEIWQQELANSLTVNTYTLQQSKNAHGQLAQVYVHHAQFNNAGITASVHTPWGEGVLHNSQLIGQCYLSNLLAVLTVLGILGIPLQTILADLARVHSVPGRMEKFSNGKKPLVVVDYSHSPDSLEQALRTLRECCRGQLWCVFGCGGDRDSGKRPMMGKIAERYADKLVVTDDNPRNEDRRQIVLDILQGLQNPTAAVVEHDRRRAIAHAISCAAVEDIVLIAGKGHETYQIVGTEKLPFSDRLEVQMLLAEI